MKLYELNKRDVLVKYNNTNNTLPIDVDEPFLFHHLDGAYSYCTDRNGVVFHPSASTEVEVVDMNPSKDWGVQYGNA